MSIINGIFVVLEGIEGSGTTTQTELLSEFFSKDKRYHVVLTREPANSEARVKIREMLKSGTDPKENGELYTKLFIEDRKHHADKLIIPAVNYGALVFSDRYDLSTYAYQQIQGVPFEKIQEMHKGVLVPDLSIIVDVPAELGQSRAVDKEDFDKIEFQEELRQKYLELPERLKDRKILVVDGTGTIDEVQERILEHIYPLIKK